MTVVKPAAIHLSVDSKQVEAFPLPHTGPSTGESHPEQRQLEYHLWTASDSPAATTEAVLGFPLPLAKNPSALALHRISPLTPALAAPIGSGVRLDYLLAKRPDVLLPPQDLDFWTVKPLG